MNLILNIFGEILNENNDEVLFVIIHLIHLRHKLFFFSSITIMIKDIIGMRILGSFSICELGTQCYGLHPFGEYIKSNELKFNIYKEIKQIHCHRTEE